MQKTLLPCNLPPESMVKKEEKIKIVVLSRKEDTKRRLSIDRQMAALGLHHEFYDAITPSRLTSTQLSTSHTAGERCCFLSHYAIIEQFSSSSSEENLIILEDDAELTPDFKSLVPHFSSALTRTDILILGYSKVPPELRNAIQRFRPVKPLYPLDERYQVSRPYAQWKCGAVAYAISKTGAIKYTRALKGAEIVADDWRFIERQGISIHHLKPICALENYESLGSNLEEDRKSHVIRPIWLRYIAGLARSLLLIGK